MYVPTNIAAPTATYAPVTVAQNPAALAQPQAVSSIRQTEIALTGLGPTLLGNTIANRRSSDGVSQSVLLSPRPAYIAAQFLAQDVSPQEAAQFFAAPAKPQPSPQPNLSQDMRVALGLGTPSNEQIAIKQSALAQTAQVSEVPKGLAFSAAGAPLRTQIAAGTAEPLQRQSRGVQAYRSANIRNALLASPPEVDTSS